MTEKRLIVDEDYNLVDTVTGEWLDDTQVFDLANKLHEENKELKEENEYLCEKIKENEWHWNTIDEDRDVWRYKCKTLEEENEQLKLLLREVEHELTFLTGLSATDSTSIVKKDMEEYGLFRLDYTDLLKKIDKVI